MGKVFRHYKSGLRIILILFIVLLGILNVDASYREFDLFDQGYKHYLSYQPEKAIEEFRTFLREFPNSSAKDAVLFWLGKALIQLKSIEEAKQVFSDIKEQFPESPFIAYVNKESEIISKSEKQDTINETKMSMEAPASEKKEDTLRKEIKQFEEARKAKEVKEVKEERKEEEQPKETKEIMAEPAERKEQPSRPSQFTKKKGRYSVQVGVFKQKKNVDDLRKKFEGEGYPVKVIPIILEGESIFRVMIGEFSTREDADAFAMKIKRTEGVDTIVRMTEVAEKVQVTKADISKTAEEEIEEEIEIDKKITSVESGKREAEESVIKEKEPEGQTQIAETDQSS